MRVTKGFQLLGDPERPVAIFAGVADEDFGHARRPAQASVEPS